MRAASFILLLTLLLTSLTACLRPRVIIDSTPEGAIVTFNDMERGKTPITIPFKWYWEHKVQLEKEGYQTLVANEEFKPKFWMRFPLDLFVEAMPFPVYDTHKLHYTLEPATEQENLLDETEDPAIQLD